MNPFIYGEYVKGMSFINLKTEIANLTRDLLDSQKIFLISPRRYGKTSLLLRIKHELENKRVKVVYIDLFKCSSNEQLAAALAKELSKFESVSFEKAFKFIKNIISSLRPILSVNKEGELSVQIDAKPKEQETYGLLEDLLDYAQRYAKKNNTRVVIFLDEFQEIIKFGGHTIENFLRAIIQTQNRVGYVFCGSKKTIIEDMVMKKTRAFFGMGPVISLEKIDDAVWEEYLTATFKKHGFKIGKDAAKMIIERASGIPYYIQYLAHELYDQYSKEKTVKSSYIDDTVKSIVRRNIPSYETIWENLTGVQQRMLGGITKDDIENIFSDEFLTRHQIGTRPGAEKTIQLLLKKDIIEKDHKKYIISDIWFCEWINQHILDN